MQIDEYQDYKKLITQRDALREALENLLEMTIEIIHKRGIISSTPIEEIPAIANSRAALTLCDSQTKAVKKEAISLL